VRHGGVVELIDLAPTLYELARLEPSGRPSGESLARLLGRPLPPLSGAAWTESMGGVRAVYRGERRELESLLLFAPRPEDWLARRIAFDAPGGELVFEARSFEEPRRLVVRQGGKILAEAALTPGWAPVRVALDGPARLVLEADGCVVPEGAEARREGDCRAFQVRGLRLARIELYDVSRDPRQLQDLSRERTRSTRTLLRDLLAFKPVPVAEAKAAPLDPELEESLRSLGYLQ
jgi:hypothetical protein